MTLGRRRPLAEPLARAAQALKQCESKIALLDRVRPLNLTQERARLLQGLLSGAHPDFALSYAAPARLHDVRTVLDELQKQLDASDVEAALLVERAREL